MVSAPALRRKGSLRVQARLGCPMPALRLQPKAENSGVCRGDWARNLQNRMGWHCIRTRGHGNIIVVLIFLHRRTHYVNLRNLADTGRPRCLLDSNFSIAYSVHELAHLERLLADDEVMSVKEFLPTGTAAGSNGVGITLDKVLPVIGPAPAPRRKEKDGEVFEEDGEVDTDAESVADSDVDSDTSSPDASVTDVKAKVANVFLKIAPTPAAIDEKPATGGPSQTFRRRGVIPMWRDDYFWVCASTADFLHVRVRSQFGRTLEESGMGKSRMSKQVTPRDYGEDRTNPVRSLLLLRAWALWRARKDRWADARSCRATHFNEQEAFFRAGRESTECTMPPVMQHRCEQIFVGYCPGLGCTTSSARVVYPATGGR